MSMRVKSGVCVKTGAKVLVLDYGKVASADLFLVNGCIVANFGGNIHEGHWPGELEHTHELVIGLDGFVLEGERTVIAVPQSQVTGEIVLRSGQKLTLPPEPERVKVVADISGGALHGMWANKPTDVIFLSSDPDDVANMDDEPCLVNFNENMDQPEAWWLLSSNGDPAEDLVARHYHDQLANISNDPVEV